ncbi:hypothetical protein Salat_1763200 [Sesamum alatum]|uniref:PB1-like domain-containing protein n=1 Tax=Sesamum alatum TaxID=300844 RepID=A0AAE1Y8Z3_9LAMI|nr:hypothetical protein Salat_1763200 [Sesamum alatum]
MSLRPSHLIEFENPNYDEHEFVVTFKIHHGETLVHMPEAQYVGGTLSAFDYFDLSCLSISYIDGLVQQLGYNGVKKYYRLERGKWRSVLYQTDLMQLSDGYVTKNRELVLYLDAVLDGIGTQIGSSNPIVEGDNPPIKPNGEDNGAGDSESETDSFEDSEFDLSDGDKNEGGGEDGGEDEPGGEGEAVVGDAGGDKQEVMNLGVRVDLTSQHLSKGVKSM